jgi:hypothetical protein
MRTFLNPTHFLHPYSTAWKEMYSLTDSAARGRAKVEGFSTPDRIQPGSNRESLSSLTPAELRAARLDVLDTLAPTPGDEPSTPGSTWGGFGGGGGGPSSSLFQQVSMPQHAFHDIIDSMSVQMFGAEQIAAMINEAEPMQVEGRDVYTGTFKVGGQVLA